MEDILLSLAVSAIFGLLVTRLAKKVNLPAVTAYLIGGLLMGPFCIGALGISGIGFESLEMLDNFKVITQSALGFIAFIIGNEFRLTDLKKMGRQAIIVGILQAVITTALVDIALLGLHAVAPSVISVSSAITLGAIASATAPAATLMVVRQYKAKGPLTKLLLMVVAIDDAVGLILFSASYGVANALEKGSINVTSVVVEPLIEIGLSFLLGAICGYFLHVVERYFFSRSKRLAIAVSFVYVTVGLSMKHFEIAGIHCGFSLLLVCMITGTVFCNINEASEDVMGRIERWNGPLNILFFVISGAELDLSILVNPVVLLIGVIYIAFRSAGKISGSFLSTSMTGCSAPVRKYLGVTLLPQAGVALGMAVTASTLADGVIVRNVVLFSVLVYEIVGPTLTKLALIAAGEIDPAEEAKENSRVENEGGREIAKHFPIFKMYPHFKRRKVS